MKAEARNLSTRIVKRVDVRYWLWLPRPRPAWRVPLLLFLHGAGERGDDLQLVLKHGPPRLLAAGRRFPFAVLAPQCPAGEGWQPDTLQALLDDVSARHRIDAARIYLMGLSMGGMGTWALAHACPERFAAIAPICGLYTWVDARRFRGFPTWCFHGALDPVVPVGESVRMVNALREHGAKVRFTVLPDAAHDCWTPVYAGAELYAWLRRHARSRA